METKRLYTPNKSKMVIQPEGVVFHHTGTFSLQSTLDWFADKKSRVSAHCVIDLTGNRYVFGDDNEKLFHAGFSYWKDKLYCNNFTIGIEFVGDTNRQPLTMAQIESALFYLSPKADRYEWTIDDFTDHRTVRKNYINKFGNHDGRLDEKSDLTPVEFTRLLNHLKAIIL